MVYFSFRKSTYATFHPLGIFRCHWLSMFTFLFTWKVLRCLNMQRNRNIKLLMFIFYLNVFLSRYCMHVELGLEESRIRYEAGDHVAIYPTNDLQLVNKIGQLLDIDLDTVFTMKALDEDATKKSPFPVPTTYRTALKHYVHVFANPEFSI